MTIVERLFKDLNLETAEQRAKFVTFMLGDNDKVVPFYYREWPKKGKPRVSRGNLFFRITYCTTLIRAYFCRMLSQPLSRLILALSPVSSLSIVHLPIRSEPLFSVFKRSVFRTLHSARSTTALTGQTGVIVLEDGP